MKKVIILLIICITPSLMFGATPVKPKVTEGLCRSLKQTQILKIMDGLARNARRQWGKPQNFRQVKTILPPTPLTIKPIPSVYPQHLIEEFAGNYQLHPQILPTDAEILRLLVYTLKENDYSISSPLFTLKHVEGDVNPTFYLEFHKEFQMLCKDDGNAYHVMPGDVVKVDFAHAKLLPLSKEEALETQKLRIHPSQQYLSQVMQNQVRRYFDHVYAQDVAEVGEDLTAIHAAMNNSLHPRNFLYPSELYRLAVVENPYIEEAELSVTSVESSFLARPKKSFLIVTSDNEMMPVDSNYLLEIFPHSVRPIYKPK